MQLVDKKFVKNNEAEIIKAIHDGKIFIYPTDTIYGLGANALNTGAVLAIREIKQRPSKALSVIAPSIEWIRENCMMNDEVEKNLKKLPGPFTFFLNLKNQRCVSQEINPLDEKTLGVRIPKHWFTKIIQKAGVPFITTSANMSDESYMRGIEDLDKGIKEAVDYIVYEGVINGEESTKIDLTDIK